ncbi:MAG: hypothetical protein GY805_02195 [Chloroflexi bacterium]|nr:hypothetical protein [Chloroflexota bacterium]
MMKIVTFAGKRPLVPLIAILLLAFALRLHALDSQSLWWDELKTVQRANMSFSELFADLAGHRAHLPLYFILMRGWSWLGNSAFIVRLFSVIWGVLGVTAVFQLGRQIGSTKVGLTAAFLLAISPFHIYYSQETRMYSMLVTLLIFAHVGLIAILQEANTPLPLSPTAPSASLRLNRNWLLYFLAMTTAVYTHYFTFLIIFAHTIFFILHLRPLKPISFYWFGLMTLLAVLFAPWAIVIIGRSGYNQAIPIWINTVQLIEPILTLWTFSIGATLSRTSLAGILGFTLFMLGLLGSFRALHKQPKDKNNVHKLFFFWLFIPLLFIYLISLGNGSFSLYLDRYLIVVLPIYLLLVAWGWVHLTGHSVPWLLGLGILATAVTTPSLLNLYNNPTFARNDWQKTFATIAAEWQPTDSIIGTRDVQLPVEFYGTTTMPYLEIPPSETDSVTPAFSRVLEQQLLARTEVGRFWLVEPFYIFDPHQWPDVRNAEVTAQLNTPHHQWLYNEFTHLQTWHFTGVRLSLYQTNEPNN